MKWLEEVRQVAYEATKDMTPEERVQWRKESLATLREKHGWIDASKHAPEPTEEYPAISETYLLCLEDDGQYVTGTYSFDHGEWWANRGIVPHADVKYYRRIEDPPCCQEK